MNSKERTSSLNVEEQDDEQDMAVLTPMHSIQQIENFGGDVSRNILCRMRISLKCEKKFFYLTLFDGVRIDEDRQVIWEKCLSFYDPDALDNIPVDLYKFVRQHIFSTDLEACKIYSSGHEVQTRDFLCHAEDVIIGLIILGNHKGASLPEDVKKTLFSNLDKDKTLIKSVQDKAERMYEKEKQTLLAYERYKKRRIDFENEWNWTLWRDAN